MIQQLRVDDSIVCRWLSNSYAHELSDRSIQVYLSDGMRPILSYIAQAPHLESHVRRIDRAVQNWRRLENVKLDLAGDFASMFLIDARTCAPAYASFYLGKDKQFFNESSDRMRERLAIQQLSVRIDQNEPADYLPIMLEFLSRCLEVGPNESAEPRVETDVREFIRTELLSWLPAFAERAGQVKTSSDFYKAVVSLTVPYLDTLASRQA